MADITATVPIKLPAARALRWRAPLLGICRGIGTVLQAYSEAIELAHMAPWAGPAKQKGPAPEAELQGRDPNW